MQSFFQKETSRHVLAAVVFCLLGTALYFHTLPYPFVFDDKHNILENHAIRVTKLDWSQIKTAVVHSPLQNRPVAYLSFAVTYLFADYNPVAYRAANIGIHCIAGVLLYFFIWKTLVILAEQKRKYTDPEPAVSRKGAAAVAFSTTLIWLLHPVQVGSVVYIVQRMTSMCAMFYLASLLLYVIGRTGSKPGRKRQIFAYAGSVVCGLLALGTKEIAATLPVVIFLYEWIILQRTDTTFIKRRKWFLLGGLAIIGGVSLTYLGTEPFQRILSGYEIRPFTLPERVLTELRIIVFYISLLILPLPGRLSLEHYFAPSTSLIQPLTTLGAFLFILAALAGALWLLRRWRLMGFCILWYFIHLLIESSIMPLELVFEHRLYLPSVGIVLPVVILGWTYLPYRWTLRAGITAAVIVLFAGGTWIYSQFWRSRLALATHSIHVSPRKARPYSTRAVELAQQGKLRLALGNINKAQELRPNLPTLYYNEGKLLFDAKRYDRAEKLFRKTLRMAPEFVKAHVGLGSIYVRRGEPEKALDRFNRALTLSPNYVQALVYRGMLRENFFDTPRKAVEDYQKAKKLAPHRQGITYKLARTYLKLDRPKKAEQLLNKLPANFAPRYKCFLKRGIARLKQDKYQPALNDLKKAITILTGKLKQEQKGGTRQRLKTDCGEAFYYAAQALGKTGAASSAQEYRKKARDLGFTPNKNKDHSP